MTSAHGTSTAQFTPTLLGLGGKRTAGRTSASALGRPERRLNESYPAFRILVCAGRFGDDSSL